MRETYITHGEGLAKVPTGTGRSGIILGIATPTVPTVPTILTWILLQKMLIFAELPTNHGEILSFIVTQLDYITIDYL
jgi:hypothetical protein